MKPFSLDAMGRAVAGGLLWMASAAQAQPPAPAPLSIAATGPGGHTASISAADLARLPAITATLPAGHGPPGTFAGPALWPLLKQAGAIDPDLHKHVREIVTITGADGYTAVPALGEIDPEFEGKAAMLATSREGQPLPMPRLVIPGEKRAGREVRDVVRLDVK